MVISVLKNITISSFRKIPGALLIVLALILLTEWSIYLLRPILIDDYWNKFIINEHNLIDQPGDYDYLIIGDSIQKTGINPRNVDDKILSLGLPGAKPTGLYIMLKRYLAKHKAPKAIFLFVDPEDQRDSSLVVLRYFIAIPEAISLWKDLTPEERKCFVMKYWASLDMRKVGMVVRDKYPGANSSFVEEMRSNNGYMAAPGTNKTIEDDFFVKTKRRYAEKTSMSGIDIKYLDRFVKLAESKNIKIVFLGALFPKELYGILEKSGFNSDYLSFLEKMKLKYPNVYFVKDPILYLDNKYFGDMTHVNKAGSAVYTQYFKTQVFAPLIEKEGK